MTTGERVFVTGLGVVAPNGVGVAAYRDALMQCTSGITWRPEMAAANLGCQVAGVPAADDITARASAQLRRHTKRNHVITYALLAALECWQDAGLELPSLDEPQVAYETGAIIGTGIGGIDTVAHDLVPKVDAGSARRLGSAMPELIMVSSAAAKVAEYLALGGPVSANSSACATGAEALLSGYHMIRDGRVERMLVGGTEAGSAYIWASFDAMRVLERDANDDPATASRPFGATAGGFVPAAGCAILLLEAESAMHRRGARPYAELLGGAMTCGGFRNGGTMTAPSNEGVLRCISAALESAAPQHREISLVSGHVTGTFADPLEIETWAVALERAGRPFPFFNAPKALLGHALGAAGALECAAVALQISAGFIHGTPSARDPHPRITPFIDRIPVSSTSRPLDLVAKTSFGFGDVNVCLVFAAPDF